MKKSYFSRDVQEFLYLLHRYDVKYVVVGGEAVIYYGYARLTGDIDFFYDSEIENIGKLFSALLEFWDGDIPGIVDKKDLAEPGIVLQFGIVPNRIDLLNKIDGVDFAEAWFNRRTEFMVMKGEKISVNYIGINQLIKNKEAIQRNKDLEDLKYLNKVEPE